MKKGMLIVSIGLVLIGASVLLGVKTREEQSDKLQKMIAETEIELKKEIGKLENEIDNIKLDVEEMKFDDTDYLKDTDEQDKGSDIEMQGTARNGTLYVGVDIDPGTYNLYSESGSLDVFENEDKMNEYELKDFIWVSTHGKVENYIFRDGDILNANGSVWFEKVD